MRKPAFKTAAAAAIAALLAGMMVSAQAADAKRIAEGKKLAWDRKLGNCLACHQMGDGVSPGNIGPPLVAMKARWPDRAKLRAQIWDATARNPESVMPPFGRHQALTEEQIDLITDYVQTL
jgi:sulfur-oxidizing protein SoxX